MNITAYTNIKHLIERNGIHYLELSHEPSKTSEESKAVRASAGYPDTEGAKALLTKLYFADGDTFATIVVPGSHTLDTRKLLATVPGLKKIRFATPEELLRLAGVVPGCMPPFASQIFPNISLLIVSSALALYDHIGFNAAYLEKSIILTTHDYLSVVTPLYVVDCSSPKQGQENRVI